MAQGMTGNAVGDPESRRGDDLPGEELAGHDLAEPEAYAIAPDETEAEELEAADDAAAGEGSLSEVEIDDPAQLADAEEEAREAESTEPETLAARVRSSRPQRKAPAAPKNVPTPVRRRAAATPEAEKRATPTEFVRQSADELKKVVWPTGRQVQQYFAVVLVFVLFIMAFVVSLDTGFGWVLLRLFG